MKVWVIGAPGAGKTTIARRLGRDFGVPVHELDALFWRPGWQIAPRDAFVAGVAAVTAGTAWVVDGNYAAAAPLLTAAADLLLWLDLPFPRTYWRVLTRTARRLLTRDELWNGNRESLRIALGADGLPAYALLKHGRNRERFAGYWQAFAGAKVRVTRAADADAVARAACREVLAAQQRGGA